jgi:ACS family tartrate transporter-like MFS transporter
MDINEKRTMEKVSRRLIPFVIICYFVAYLDRVNLSFAALEMNKDLKFSSTVYGIGAGAFFLSYFLLETPSNLVMLKMGPRRWIARIMFTWGILSGAMAFVWNEPSFYVVRFLFGAAEAGFFPGILYYLTLYFPAAYRARMVSMFMVAIPVSAVIGAPLSTSVLYMDGFLGLRGWQWVFIRGRSGADPRDCDLVLHDRESCRSELAGKG